MCKITLPTRQAKHTLDLVDGYIPGLFLFRDVFKHSLINNMYKNCQCLDLNPDQLVFKATAVPTMPHISMNLLALNAQHSIYVHVFHRHQKSRLLVGPACLPSQPIYFITCLLQKWCYLPTHKHKADWAEKNVLVRTNPPPSFLFFCEQVTSATFHYM